VGPMRVAYGPNREFINIRGRGEYERWHGQGGLRCVVCWDKVHPYRLDNGNTWLRHTAGSEARHHAAAIGSGGQSYEHVSLTHWVCAWLKSQGHEAKCDRQVGSSRPDVQAMVHGRRLAIEIQVSYIRLSEAQRRTELLTANGYDVVWLTRNLDWVDQMPAVGLHVEEERPRYRTTEVHGRFYSVREGILSCGTSGRLVPGVKRPALDTFLKHYVGQSTRWAAVGCDGHGEHFGWAMTDDWQQHMGWQAKQLREFTNERTQQESRLRLLQSSLEDRERDLRLVTRELSNERANARDLRERLAVSISRTRHAHDGISQREHQLRLVQAELRGSVWGRRLLKRIGWR